jgi:hypothetical protein
VFAAVAGVTARRVVLAGAANSAPFLLFCSAMFPFLLTLLIFSLAVRYGLPLLARWVLGRVVRQATGGAYGAGAGRTAGGGPRAASAKSPDGQVRVAYTPPRPKRQPRPGGYVGGEYVEFEDVR